MRATFKVASFSWVYHTGSGVMEVNVINTHTQHVHRGPNPVRVTKKLH